jgi:predicted metal-binding membrane protein
MRNLQSQRAFLAVCGLTVPVSWAVTSSWCRTMSAMGGMTMPGDWVLSMTWMRMPGESWTAVAASFLGMWTVMMIAMMSPSLVAVLWRYRRALEAAGASHVLRLTVLTAAAYFLGWAAFGLALFPVGAALAALAMRVPGLARAVPPASGVILIAAGALQFTKWKLHHLMCCRSLPSRAPPAKAWAAGCYGVRLSAHCAASCIGATAVLLAAGVMDLRAMAAVTVAITLERLAPASDQIARLIGAVAIGIGVCLLARQV